MQTRTHTHTQSQAYIHTYTQGYMRTHAYSSNFGEAQNFSIEVKHSVRHMSQIVIAIITQSTYYIKYIAAVSFNVLRSTKFRGHFHRNPHIKKFEVKEV